VPPPAYADQTLLVADNGTVHCEASAKDLTRISLKDDQFASVSKVQAANPADDFQVVNEPLRGTSTSPSPMAFPSHDLLLRDDAQRLRLQIHLRRRRLDARQVFIANADVEHPRPVGEQWPAGLSAQDASSRLIAAMYPEADRRLRHHLARWCRSTSTRSSSRWSGNMWGRATPASCSRSPTAAPNPQS
jgi:conjugal transfer pilus assembly protein TraK